MNLLLFLGAGVSAGSGLPTAEKLTERLFEPRPDESDETRGIRALLEVIRDYDTADIPRVGLFRGGVSGFDASGAIYRAKKTTYEDLYYLCEEISLWNVGLSDNSQTTAFMERIEKNAGALLEGSGLDDRMWHLARFGRRACAFIESIISATLRRNYVAGLDLIADLATCPDVEQLNIVTLNHDTLVEQFLSAKGIGLVDGFGEPDGDVRWSDDRLYDDPGARVRLFKLHGSVDWYAFRPAGELRTAVFPGADLKSAKDAEGRKLAAAYATSSLLSGINKSVWYHRGIYADLHFRFADLLRKSSQMLMSGYGWGDTAINFQLQTWLDRTRNNRLMILHRTPKELTDRSKTLREGFEGWTESGQLTCMERWLSETSMSEVRGIIATESN